MAEMNFQREVLGSLTELKRNIELLRKDVDCLTGTIQDAKLTKKEREGLERSIAKVQSGNTTGFMSWKLAKKKLGV